MSFYALSALINTIVSLALSFFVYTRNRKKTVNKCYVLTTITIGIWSLSYFFWQISSDKSQALFWCRTLMVGAIFIPPTYLHFVLSLLELNLKKRKLITTLYTIAFIFFTLNFTPLFVKEVSAKLFFRFWPDAGKAYLPFLVFYAFCMIFAVIKMQKEQSRLSGIRKTQIRYVIFGIIVGFGGGATNFPLWYNINIPPAGNILVSAGLGIMAYAIIKYRLMDIKVAITRAGIFAFVYSMVLGIPFILGLYVKSWLIPTAIMFLLATSGPLIYERLRKRAENVLLSQQRRYQKTLVHAAAGMVKIKNLKHLINLIVHIVTKTVKVEMAAIFSLDKERNLYRLEAWRDKELFTKELIVENNHPLILLLAKTRNPLLLEDIQFLEKDNLKAQQIKDFFDTYKIQLVIPSFSERNLLGFLVLGSKSNNQVFTQDDINVFKILANQTSLAIENCLFLEEFQKTQEKIFRADKLATIGAMAEGVSHQMNNRLQAFAAVAGDLKDVIQTAANKENSENFKEDLNYCLYGLNKIEKNVLHSSQIIKGILNYARTEKDSSFRFLDIKELIDVALELLGVKHNLKEFSPDFTIPQDIPQVYGSAAQLSEAIFNLIDNAYEAMEEKNTYFMNQQIQNKPEKILSIEIHPLQNSLILKISDNGMGIKDEDRPKMFAPFYTTKSSAKSGTGLGMYVVKKIIEENHKGKIWFESEYMKGSCFYVELPTLKY